LAQNGTLRICLFTPTFFPRLGGAEVVVDALARQFRSMGHTPVVLAPQPPPDRDDEVDVPYRVERYKKPVWPQWRPERIRGALIRSHHRHHFDLVLAFYGQPTGYAALRAREQTRVPVVLVCQGGDLYREHKTRRRPHRWRRVRAAYRDADAVVAISDYTHELITELTPTRRQPARIPNGIEPSQVTAPAERPTDFSYTKPFCLCLGNLIEQKCFDDAIAAFAEARPALASDLQLVIVGAGRLNEALQTQARELGVEAVVHFMGQRTGNDKRWFLQQCRFALMPSREEAFGIVALEVLASGRPLVCTDSSAFDAVCEHRVNGLRVPVRDREALKQAIIEAEQNDWAGLHERNAARLAAFTWPEIARQYIALFRDVIA